MNFKNDSTLDSKLTLIKKVEKLVLEFVNNLSNLQPPSLRFENTLSWDNVSFTEEMGLRMIAKPTLTSISMTSLNSFTKLGRIFKVLSIVYSNVITGSHSTKRDIYYQNPKLFGNKQSSLDNIVETIALLLKTPRESLNVHASGKGLVAGNLKFVQPNGHLVNCQLSKMGVVIPSCINHCTKFETDAHFVLIIEKDASFQRIIEEQFCEKYGPCVIITGKGFPDVNTRTLVKILWDTFNILIYCLVDADPHGIEILSTYKYGSKSLCHENHRLAVPTIIWLGLLPSDIERLHIPKEVLLPMTKLDVKKAGDMLRRYTTIHCSWKTELDIMLKWNMKAEIQCLDNISRGFLVDVYLPNKIKHATSI